MVPRYPILIRQDKSRLYAAGPATLCGMSTAEEFREKAEECRQQSDKAVSLRDKAVWLRIAESWLKMAQKVDDRRPKAKKS
jgi:hypothetical protein